MSRSYSDLLAGVRVVELCWAWAGPLAARTLGDLGAEVIKIEGPSRPDGVRFGNYPNNEPGDNPWDRGGHFQKHSRNKKSLVLDIATVRGRELFMQLIAQSDVFIENNAPRVLTNLRIGYRDLQPVRPDLIMVSMPGFGSDGPRRDWVGFGLNLGAYCGLSTVTGYADTGPVRSMVPYGDPIAALHATVATLAALRERRRTGQGQHIEVAQDESLINILVEPLLRSFQHGGGFTADGAHDPDIAPHNAYATRGHDQWICLVARDESSFAALAGVVGHPEWAHDPDLASPFLRKRRESRLDGAIGSWAAQQERDQAVEVLNSVGVPAAAARRIDEIVSDPMLWRRGYWRRIEHPVTGTLTYSYLPFSLWRSEPGAVVHAPVFGEHNLEVLQGYLGLSDQDIDELEGMGIITSRPNMA